MNHFHLSSGSRRTAVQATLVIVFASSCSAQGLPGSKGPRVENVAAPPSGLELLWIAVVDDLSTSGVSDAPQPGDRERTLLRTFPSGTKQVTFLVDFARTPPGGTNIGIGILCKGGAIEFPEFNSMMSATKGLETRVVISRRPKFGAFPDGPCQGTLSLNEQAVARLNWSIGS